MIDNKGGTEIPKITMTVIAWTTKTLLPRRRNRTTNPREEEADALDKRYIIQASGIWGKLRTVGSRVHAALGCTVRSVVVIVHECS